MFHDISLRCLKDCKKQMPDRWQFKTFDRLNFPNTFPTETISTDWESSILHENHYLSFGSSFCIIRRQFSTYPHHEPSIKIFNFIPPTHLFHFWNSQRKYQNKFPLTRQIIGCCAAKSRSILRVNSHAPSISNFDRIITTKNNLQVWSK